MNDHRVMVEIEIVKVILYSADPMIMGICPINKIYNAGTIPHSQRYLAGQIPIVQGFKMDFTLNDYGEMSVFFIFEAPCIHNIVVEAIHTFIK